MVFFPSVISLTRCSPMHFHASTFGAETQVEKILRNEKADPGIAKSWVYCSSYTHHERRDILEVEDEVEVNLRPTVSRRVCLSVEL
jgi:hypothetical protein